MELRSRSARTTHTRQQTTGTVQCCRPGVNQTNVSAEIKLKCKTSFVKYICTCPRTEKEGTCLKLPGGSWVAPELSPRHGARVDPQWKRRPGGAHSRASCSSQVVPRMAERSRGTDLKHGGRRPASVNALFWRFPAAVTRGIDDAHYNARRKSCLVV